MTTPETAGKVSPERLNQIAQRKLAALGLKSRATGSGFLEGELPITAGRVSHPTTGISVTHANFLVVGHDRVRFINAPFSGLDAVVFYDVDSVAAFEARLLSALSQRVQALKGVGSKLKTLGLATTLDADALTINAWVTVGDNRYEIVGSPGLVRVRRVVPPSGEPKPVPEKLGAIPVEEFTTTAEFELFLEASADLKQIAGGESAPAPPPASTSPSLESLAPEAGALSLVALAKLGGSHVAVSDATLMQTFEHEGKRYVFTAKQVQGNTFEGKLSGPRGEKWSERFDLTRFPGIAIFVANLLNVTPEAPTAPAPEAPRKTIPAVPAHLEPHAGEVWVMSVIVEQDDGNEIRYACVDMDGKPYGAARILKKADFDVIFSQLGTGWRLRIRVEDVVEGHVLYRQLARDGRASEALKKMPVTVLASNFMPEAAAY
ncbi:MAG: hypothetical protein ACKVPX_02960 [Myxococcaceae bacterium]